MQNFLVSAAGSAPSTTAGKVWFLTTGTNPLGFAVARRVLAAGDSVAIGCTRGEFEVLQAKEKEKKKNRDKDKGSDVEKEKDDNDLEDKSSEMINDEDEEIQTLDLQHLKNWGRERCLIVPLDVVNLASCQTSLAEILDKFQKVDVLINCINHTYAGAVEETAEWQARAQFDISYIGPVNVIRTMVRDMRRKGNGGHIINVTSLCAQLGTPGLSLVTAAHHAMSGFLDGLAYEVAPWNIKITDVQPSLMPYLLMNPLFIPPVHAAYETDDVQNDEEEDPNMSHTTKSAAQIREMLSKLFPATNETLPLSGLAPNHSPTPLRQCSLPLQAQFEIVAETVKILMMVAGRDNPPGRVIVRDDSADDEPESEEIQSVKDKMKTISEELEEFLTCGTSVDIGRVGDDDEDADDILML